MKGKIQKTESGVFVVVETENSSNRHYSHLDFEAELELMTPEEINEAFEKLTLTLKDKKNLLKKVNGYAISECSAKDGSFNYGDLFTFKKT
jgi:hypothetical protein